jgi:tetratricopeptide (TPR) repeat protein
MQFRFTRLAAAMVIALSVATAGCGKYSISNIRSLKAFQDASVLYKKADYKGAVKLYEESVSHNPDLGFAYFYLGNSYDNQFKTARKDEPEMQAHLHKAVENYRRAIDKMAGATDDKEKEIRKLAYAFLIAAYGTDKLDDFSKAEPVARELIALDPNEPTNYQALGGLYEKQARFDDAEASFKKAIEVKPNDPMGYQMLAGYYNRLGEFEKTMDAFQQRADKEPKNPEAWHTMGTFYFDKVNKDHRLTKAVQKDYVLKGIEAENKALGLNSDYFEAVTYKNILLRMQANLEPSPAKRKELMDEADELMKKGVELQKRQGTTAAGTDKKGK